MPFKAIFIFFNSKSQDFTSEAPYSRPSLKLRAFSIVTAAIACNASRVKNAGSLGVIKNIEF